jgi:hypothetical protein
MVAWQAGAALSLLRNMNREDANGHFGKRDESDQMTNIDPFDLLMPPVVTLAVLVLGYSQSRMIRRGQPLSSIKRKLLFYGPAFTLGMGYAIILQDQIGTLLHWRNGWIAVIVVWGALLAAVAWMRYRKDQEKNR